ncbi:MAG: cache domain-containing protein [Polyangiaceae bacterium]|nr:cache domain-containing protein [Polyangiaceae bacterium]
MSSVVVLLVGFLSYFLAKGAVATAAGTSSQVMAEAKRSSQTSAVRVQHDGLRTERWLSTRVNDPSLLDVMGKGTPQARADAATQASDSIMAAAKTTPVFGGVVPSIILIVDSQGLVVGRNGTGTGRGDNLAALYPGLKECLASGQSSSEIWANRGHNDQHLASFAPIRENGKIIGALVAGFTLNDELSRVSEASGGRSIKLASTENGEILASSQGSDAAAKAVEANAKTAATGALSGGVYAAEFGEYVVAGALLDGFSGGKKVAILSAAPAVSIDPSVIFTPIMGATLVGIALVAILGWLLGAFIERPIEIIEEGLLAIINGQSDRRFRLDHPDLGGVAFRLDQLLNQLMGVEEDNTDDEGRITQNAGGGARPEGGGGNAPAAGANDEASRLRSEPANVYYERLYAEYIAMKKSVGEPTDHITPNAFTSKIQQMEAEALQKGTTVRYRANLNGREVQLLAVNLK